MRRGETGVPGENLSVQRREPTNSTHIWRRIWESNPGHIGKNHRNEVCTSSGTFSGRRKLDSGEGVFSLSFIQAQCRRASLHPAIFLSTRLAKFGQKLTHYLVTSCPAQMSRERSRERCCWLVWHIKQCFVQIVCKLSGCRASFAVTPVAWQVVWGK